MAPSMAPTVLHTHTAPPSAVSRGPVDPRHAWMNLHRNRIFRKRDEKHPRMAWIYCRPRSTSTNSKPRHPDGSRKSVEGGVGPVAGDAASPPPGPGPAAGGCAFGRLRSSASQAKRPHPCKLGRALLVCASCAHGKTGVGRPAQPARGMPRAHGAHAPATGPTPPSTDFRDPSGWRGLLLVDVDLGRHVDPRDAWMDFWAYRRM